jgi:hypothetical protein
MMQKSHLDGEMRPPYSLRSVPGHGGRRAQGSRGGMVEEGQMASRVLYFVCTSSRGEGRLRKSERERWKGRVAGAVSSDQTSEYHKGTDGNDGLGAAVADPDRGWK